MPEKSSKTMHIQTEKIPLVEGPNMEAAHSLCLLTPHAASVQAKFRAQDGRVFAFYLFYLGSTYCTRDGFYSFIGGPAEPSLFRTPSPESRTCYVGKFNPTTKEGHLFEIPHDAQKDNPYLALILFGGDGS